MRTAAGLTVALDAGRGDPYRHRNIVTAVGMVARDEALLLQALTDDEFRLHAVGACLCHGMAAGVPFHVQWDFPVEYALAVAGDAFLQACQLAAVVGIGHVEHAVVRREAECVGRVRLFLRGG